MGPVGVDYGRRVVNSFFETSKKSSSAGRSVRGLRSLFNLTLVSGLAAVILVTGLYVFVANEYEDDLGRTYPELAQDSYVYDAQGKKIGEIPAAESRETVGRAGLGEYLPEAVVAVEDRRFYEHLGVDSEGLGRAAWTDLRAWEYRRAAPP
jgi:membrane peptidoglycan carboxypeptidase